MVPPTICSPCPQLLLNKLDFFAIFAVCLQDLFCIRLPKGSERLFLCAIEIQHSVQSCHFHQSHHFIRQVAQPHPAAGLADGDVRADEPPELGRIHVGNVPEVDQDLQVSLPNQLIQPLAQSGLTLASQLFLYRKNDHPTHNSLLEGRALMPVR